MSPLPALVLGRRAASARGSFSLSDTAKVAIVTVLAAAYATLRYNVAKGVPWADWPSYIANKVLAVSGVVLLAWAALRKLRGNGSAATLMLWGGSATLAHVLLSLALFSSGYFDKLFAGGKLTFAGGLSMLFAALATIVLEVGARQAQHWTVSGSQRATAFLLILSALHTMTPSASSWFEPATWPGHLPPLTLLATIPAAFAVSVWALGNRPG